MSGLVLLAAWTFMASLLHAQTAPAGEDGSGPLQILLAKDTAEAAELAPRDIAAGKPGFLLPVGEFVPIHTTDSLFEGKYGITYVHFGCVGPEKAMAVAYNQVVLRHLQRQYGRRWRQAVRRDVVGLDRQLPGTGKGR